MRVTKLPPTMHEDAIFFDIRVADGEGSVPWCSCAAASASTLVRLSLMLQVASIARPDWSIATSCVDTRDSYTHIHTTHTMNVVRRRAPTFHIACAT